MAEEEAGRSVGEAAADQTEINQVMGAREWAALLLLSLLWGGSFFFVGVAVGALPPLAIVALRVGLAALALWAVIAALKVRVPRESRVWAAFLGMGVLNNVVPFTLIVWGQTQIASGLASILNATTPFFTVVVAGLLLPDERITPLKLLGVGIGFLGVVALIGPEALSGLAVEGASPLWAQLAVLGAALSYGFAGVYGRRFRAMKVEPMVTAAGQVTASTLLLGPLALIVDQPWTLPAPGLGVWAAILGLALISTSAAYILYFRLLASAGAINLLLVTFLIPVSAILLGAVFLGERLESAHFLGMALIGLGLSAIDGRLWRRRRSALS